MPASSAVCDRCRILLTADHVRREGAPLCFRCALWLLRASDLATAAAPAQPRPPGRGPAGGALSVAFDRFAFPSSAVAARLRRPAKRRRSRAAA